MRSTTVSATERGPVAIVGAGLIGRAWAIVFARAGHPVRLHDMDLQTLHNSHAYIEARLDELAAFDLLDDAPLSVLERITCVPDLADALRDVVLVQENVRETVEAKIDIFTRMDALAPKGAILASSTSWLPASRFTEGLPGRGRCIVAHPTNPPYLIPLVELCPAPWTDAEVTVRAHDIYSAAGQSPVVLSREIHGFLLNRVQAAVLNECFKLHEDGLASAEDIDRVLKDGLALRWSFMGPFETIDLNAPAGVSDYAKRYGQQNRETIGSDTAFGWSEPAVARVHAERRQHLELEAIAARSAWRDRRLMALAAHKRQAPSA
ncbi:3-hydroxyacyl-CoA dehydrogenase [Pseudomonas alkylphenolica]|uniref:3-hydroxyacyl-CoA dehydrogenase n=1 Tax=Pseudomonas alkylphenolica TaxID=237609 RepID=UPI0018D9877B|nr:3-hydroxyacyl-CoA dehydrogenase [Pseudomonas alkylphenolica]MBH3430047.1 3-hydroxyacyl-CoA dehydrogenase [Pseudomonas alkylphenolica]